MQTFNPHIIFRFYDRFYVCGQKTKQLLKNKYLDTGHLIVCPTTRRLPKIW